MKVCEFCGHILPADAISCRGCNDYKGVVEKEIRCLVCGRSGEEARMTVAGLSEDGEVQYCCIGFSGCRKAVRVSLGK